VKKSFFIISTIFLLFFILSCAKKEKEPDQVVLAQIGDRTLTLAEFIKRSEYTIRPMYAKDNTMIHKKIILNSLVAEKLMAIEEGDSSQVMQTPYFQNFIDGRKEQEMRKWLFRKEGTEKASVDTSVLKDYYKWAGREYEVDYFSVPSPEMADSVAKMLEQNIPFEKVYDTVANIDDPLPSHTIIWQNEGSDNLVTAVYSDSLEIGLIVGPVRTESGMYTTLRIKDWTTNVAITDEQIGDRWTEVKDRIHRIESENVYREFVAQVMKGKELDFNRDIFFKVADIMKPFYLKSEQQRQQEFNTQYWQDEKPQATIEPDLASFDDIQDEPFLTIDGDTWTVAQFREELSRHPLVFRRKNFNEQNFPAELRLAIVDLVRDKSLTQVAYDRNYDELERVQQHALMWQDNVVAMYHAGVVLKEMGSTYNFSKDYLAAITDYLNPYVDSLQVKYSDQVAVNMDIFKDIELTRIDMFVMDKNVPYPVKVPQFPLLTTDTKLDYGRDSSQEMH